MTGRMADRVVLLLWLAAVWLLLWGSLSALVVLSAVLVAPLSLAACRLPARRMLARPRVRRLPGTAARFARDLALSSAEVAWAAIRRGGRTRSAVIALTVPCPSDGALTVVANRLTLEPGTVVIDIDRPRDTVYVHVLDVHDADQVERARADAQLRVDDILRTLGEAE